MSLFLNKLLPVPFLPIGFSLTLIIYGIVARKRLLPLIGVAVLWVTSTPYFADRMLHGLERVYPRLDLQEVPAADAIVVLGGYLRQIGGFSGASPEWNEAVERFERGLDLWAQGAAPVIVFSNGGIPWAQGRQLLEGDAAAAVALARGVPDEAILITDPVGNTQDEARAVARLVKERAWTRVILVTSAFHMPRSVEHFEREGVDVIPFPCDWRADMQKPRTLLDWLPSAEALWYTELALREHYGRWFYAVLGLFR